MTTFTPTPEQYEAYRELWENHPGRADVTGQIHIDAPAPAPLQFITTSMDGYGIYRNASGTLLRLPILRPGLRLVEIDAPHTEIAIVTSADPSRPMVRWYGHRVEEGIDPAKFRYADHQEIELARRRAIWAEMPL